MNMRNRMVLGGAILILAASATFAAKPVKLPPTPTMGIEVFAAGQRIGWLLDFNGGPYYNAGDFDIYVLSPTGYFFRINHGDGVNKTLGQVEGPYFSGTGCTGEIYMYSYPGDWHRGQGGVFRAPDVMGGGIYYLPRNSQVEQRLVASYASNETCINDSRLMDVAPLLPNDASITGVSTVQFPAPIVFGIP